MKITPTHDNILIRRDEKQSVTAGGIIIHETYKKHQGHATVVAVGRCQRCDYGAGGPDVEKSYCAQDDLKPGDKILYNKWAGKRAIEIGNEDLMMIRHEDVLAVFEED